MSAPKRTLVVSDLHGDASLLDETLAHAAYGVGDRLIVAGDLIDVGPDDVISYARELGAVILAGNHEVSAALGLRISPQHETSLERGPWFMERFLEGEWPLATAVDGWLITHAGVSVALDDLLDRTDDPEATAATLNELFRAECVAAVRHPPATWDELQSFRLMGGQMGPLWFRPLNPVHVPSGVRQIVGHTPPDAIGPEQYAALEQLGWRLIEPGGHRRTRGVRYAVIENGEAEVVDTDR